MKILVWKSNYGDVYLNAEDENKAFRYLYNELLEQGFYDISSEMGEHHFERKAAMSGNIDDIKYLLKLRKEYQYESWSLEHIIEPVININAIINEMDNAASVGVLLKDGTKLKFYKKIEIQEIIRRYLK